MRHVDDQRRRRRVRGRQSSIIALQRSDAPAAHDAGARVAADPIRELGRLGDRPAARGRRAAPARASPRSAQSERARRVHGGARQRLLRRQPEQRARHVEHQQQRRRRRRAGIAVGGDRHRHAVARAARRPAAAASRAAHRTRRAAARPRCRRAPSRRRPRRSCTRGDRPTARAPRRRARAPSGVGQLVGVQLDRQPVRTRRREHAPRLRRREADRLAEGVDRVGEPGARDRGNHVAAHVVDVVVGATRELRRQRVRGEQRRAHVDAELRRRARARRAAASARVAVSRP